MGTRLALALALLAGPVAANVHPNMERGFDPDATFQLGGIDNVALFNGSLTLAIPIGMRYPVNGGFSYGLTLTYNSNVWEFQEVLENGQLKVEAFPSYFWNAGLGWRLSLGELVDKNDTLKNQTDKWMYVSPDGGAHVFYQQLHETENDNNDEVLYTRDGSYLRMVVEPGHEQEFNTWKRIEFPDGTLHSFRKFSGSWKLEKIQDRFGNFVSIAYVDPTGPDDEWHLTDNWGRQTKVYFEGAANLPPRVKEIRFPKFGTGVAIWEFDYLDEPRHRSDKDTLDANDNGQGEDIFTVSMLTKITMPEGLYYEMRTGDGSGTAAYNNAPCGSSDCPGTIQRLRLPTGGRLEWTYQAYDYPQGPKGWLNTTTGVKERKLVRKGVGGAVEAAWIYSNERYPAGGPYNEVRTHVTGSDGNDGIDGTPGTCTTHYFAAPPALNNQTWLGWEYGLPFTWTESHGTGAEERYLSTRLFSESVVLGNGKRVCDTTSTKHVSTFVRFAHDRLPALAGEAQKPNWYNTNRRVEGQSTRYDSDGNVFTKTVLSDFDGIGHYRQTLVSGNLEQGGYPWDPITTFTNFNRSSGTYDIDPTTNQPTGNHDYTPLGVATPWILGVYNYQETTDPGADDGHGNRFSRTEYGFNGSTGFLDCIRWLLDSDPTDGAARNQYDVVRKFTADPAGTGNVTEDRLFGGDTNSIPITATCSIGGGFASRVTHTYDHGSRETSRLHGPQPFPYLSYNAEIDPNTGLVARTTDPQDRETTYTYDALGRPMSIVRDDVADTGYSFSNVTPLAQAKVAIDQTTSGGSYLMRSEVRFDDFGRPVLRRHRQPATGGGFVWSEQETGYDRAGRVASVSVPGDLTKKTTYMNFDALNRPTTIRPPDGSSHDVLLTYFSMRRVDTEVKVATSETGESYKKRRELYDNAGRLRKVVEFADESSFEIKTEYRYDAGGHLSWISQNHEGTVKQKRFFSYDNRGFMTAEWHPEKGPPDLGATGGWVTYGNYDAAGRVGQVTDGPNLLSFTYDYAGRVTEVRDQAANPDRLVKDFVYDNNLSRYGKLYQATRHNYDPSSGADVTVKETYTYGGTGGAVSERTTQVSGLNYTFSQEFGWDEIGQLTSLTYPTCTTGSCSQLGTGLGTVAFNYVDGFLRTVPGWTTGNINYHLNGLLEKFPHSNGTTDRQDLAPSSLPRPYQLTTTSGTPVLWDSGTFAYDGAGNIKAMGENKFIYDSVSRLLQGKVGWTPQVNGWTQSYEYDEFGNLKKRTTTPPGGSGTEVTLAMNSNRNRLSMASYDTAGNMTDWIGAGSFTYDAVNQLLRLVTNDGTWKYLYTADEERAVAIRIDGGNVGYAFYIRDLGGQLLTHFTRVGPDDPASWTRTRDYVRAGGRLIGSSGTEGVRHYHPDHLGTPRIVTDENGVVWATHDYLPFGEEVTDPQQNSLALKYTGHERDKHAAGTADDIDYMHARYYGVHLARFAQADTWSGLPSIPQSLNRYSYVGGRPLTLVDTTGQVWAIPLVATAAMKASHGIGIGMTLLGSVMSAAALAADYYEHPTAVAWFTIAGGAINASGGVFLAIGLDPQSLFYIPAGGWTTAYGIYLLRKAEKIAEQEAEIKPAAPSTSPPSAPPAVDPPIPPNPDPNPEKSPTPKPPPDRRWNRPGEPYTDGNRQLDFWNRFDQLGCFRVRAGFQNDVPVYFIYCYE